MKETTDAVGESISKSGEDSIVPLDPEADAAEALKTLRQFVLEDIGPDAPPLDTWHGFDAYIDELCAYGVEKLSKEPGDLDATSLRLKNDLEEVSCGNYRALIESFECAGAVRDGVADVRSRLDGLVEALPKLAHATKQFSVNVNEKQVDREKKLRAITEHRAIADILEMPRLMRTLIAAELYDEALELRENAVKLATMHPSDSLVCNVYAEVDILTQQMILKLLVLLRNPVQLPMCLRVVGFLRRLGVFSEFRLRMLFLQCRGEWMRAGIESTTATSEQAHLVSLSDSTRAMVFEIITQYRAVFNDDVDDDDDDDLTNAIRSKDMMCGTHSSAILFDWTSSCVSDYLLRVESGIKDVRDGAALNTVLQQAMYCGQSLGRVGADFRAALPPIFEEAVLRIYNSHLNAALRQFEMMIEDNRWAPVGSSALRKDRRQSYAGPAATSKLASEQASSGQTDNDSNEQYDPPVSVLDSPPLAVFLNGILAALNELRLCAPVSLGTQLGKSLQETLISSGEYMSAVGGPGGAFLKRSDRQHFIAMSASLRDLCVQHAARCLDHCMDRNGLVDVAEVQRVLNEVFGETLVPVALSKETAAKLNGSEDTIHEERRMSSDKYRTQHQHSDESPKPLEQKKPISSLVADSSSANGKQEDLVEVATSIADVKKPSYEGDTETSIQENGAEQDHSAQDHSASNGNRVEVDNLIL